MKPTIEPYTRAVERAEEFFSAERARVEHEYHVRISAERRAKNPKPTRKQRRAASSGKRTAFEQRIRDQVAARTNDMGNR